MAMKQKKYFKVHSENEVMSSIRQNRNDDDDKFGRGRLVQITFNGGNVKDGHTLCRKLYIFCFGQPLPPHI
jgi:hypothetical protein